MKLFEKKKNTKRIWFLFIGVVTFNVLTLNLTVHVLKYIKVHFLLQNKKTLNVRKTKEKQPDSHSVVLKHF